MKLLETARSDDRSNNWVIQILPGLFVTVLILISRAFGLLESLELLAFDYFMKLRPLEEPDPRITIITISKEDIQRWGGYPISNQKIADFIEILQQHQPSVIGANILDDIMDADQEPLIQVMYKYENVVVAEKILPPQMKAPDQISADQIGFADIFLDSDTRLRRSLLGTHNPIDLDEFKFSFAIRLADKYLSSHGYELENGIQNPDAMRFGNVEIPLLDTNFGGYVGTDDGGIQTMVYFRNHSLPFSQLSAKELEEKEFSPDQIKNKIIILGITDPSTRGEIRTIISDNSQELVTGVYIQAQFASQVVNSVLSKRPLVVAWVESVEYLWIITWVGMGASFIYLLRINKMPNFPFTGGFIILPGISYLLLLQGYWVIWVPQVLILVLSGVTYFIFDKQQQAIQSEKLRLEQEQAIQKEETQRQEIISNKLKESIEETCSIIHNGPLQDLYLVIRSVRNKSIQEEELINRLVQLDRDIRNIGDHLKESNESVFYLSSEKIINLELPTHEMLYEVFRKTLDRDFSAFKKIKIKLRSFSPIPEECDLNLQLKRELCHFLAEMLCNVAKHAQNCSCLTAIGERQSQFYLLRIEDNGTGIRSTHQGQGTKHACKLAQRLGGSFSRTNTQNEMGTCCKLTFPLFSHK
ncbi:MAG: CHASE2 domain-containing protein [Symploca sp. SIO2B6]|nr:CHASE2 domain-containing protein [Symploca sp. SIO2B6]